MVDLWKKYTSLVALTSALSLGLGLAVLPGCSGDDDDDDDTAGDDDTTGDDDDTTGDDDDTTGDDDDTTGDDDDTTGDDDDTTGDDDDTTGDDDDTTGDDDDTTGDDDDTTGDDDDTTTTSVAVTFVVDTTQMADGLNKLAEVLENEQVFIVGAFNGWNPNDPEWAMTETATDSGIFELTMHFPLEAKDQSGNPFTWNPGEAGFHYKFAKTDYTAECGTGCWGNGIKDWRAFADATEAQAQCPSPVFNEGENPTNFDFSGGLYETEWNFATIPTEDTTVDITVDAWRNYAETFGYPSCN